MKIMKIETHNNANKKKSRRRTTVTMTMTMTRTMMQGVTSTPKRSCSLINLVSGSYARGVGSTLDLVKPMHLQLKQSAGIP